MRPSEALQTHREEIKKMALARRTQNVRVFGSVLRGDDAEGSDLDLLVDPMPGATLFDLGGLQVDLEEMLGVPVDLLTPGDIPARFKETVIQEAQEI